MYHRPSVMSHQEIFRRLCERLDEARTDLDRLDGSFLRELEGKFTLRLEECGQEWRLVVSWGETELFERSADLEDLAALSSHDLVDLAALQLPEMNRRLIDWFRRRIVQEVIPNFERGIRLRLSEEGIDAEMLELRFDLEDMGWWPDHHGILHEEVENPWPALALVIRSSDQEEPRSTLPIDLFHPEEALDETATETLVSGFL